jgi:hypothetical protein
MWPKPICVKPVHHKPGYPSTTNQPAKPLHGRGDAEMVGNANAFPDIAPAMTAEDFGFMLEEIPGAYGWIGNGKGGQPGVGCTIQAMTSTTTTSNSAPVSGTDSLAAGSPSPRLNGPALAAQAAGSRPGRHGGRQRAAGLGCSPAGPATRCA